MKTRKLENITGIIVIAIYLILVLLVVSVDILVASAANVSIDDFRIPMIPFPDPIKIEEPEQIIEDIPIQEEQPQSTESSNEPIDFTDEFREGKTLYIFYIAQIIEQYYNNVDPYVALAVLECESDYNPREYSYAGAVGLMQVIPKYHAWRIDKHGLDDLWDPYTNIICGIDFLSELYAKHGNWSRALFGYNASTAYVNKVLNRADILRKDGYFG